MVIFSSVAVLALLPYFINVTLIVDTNTLLVILAVWLAQLNVCSFWKNIG